MRGMTLLARRLAIRLEDRVYKRAQRSDYRPAPFHLLALRWFRARQRLAHHSPMHPELVRHCPDRPNTELVFPYGSARTALPWLSAPSPASCLFDRMLDLAGWGQFTVSKGAVSQYRNHRGSDRSTPDAGPFQAHAAVRGFGQTCAYMI